MTAVSDDAASVGAIRRLRSIMAGSAGNLVEVYDWFAYASFAIYFAKVFFPKGDQTAQLLSTAAVFLVGFLFRPVGAWLMGLYADRRGRRAALVLSVSLMCLGSLIIALCPGYAAIGPLAPRGRNRKPARNTASAYNSCRVWSPWGKKTLAK